MARLTSQVLIFQTRKMLINFTSGSWSSIAKSSAIGKQQVSFFGLKTADVTTREFTCSDVSRGSRGPVSDLAHHFMLEVHIHAGRWQLTLLEQHSVYCGLYV